MAPTRLKLSQRAIEMAMGGNTAMMIFALKNFCGWTNDGSELSKKQVYQESEIAVLPRLPSESPQDFLHRKEMAEAKAGKNLLIIQLDSEDLSL